MALIGTEDVTLSFTDDAIDALADLAADINQSVENIGARRLHPILERVLDDISFTATDKAGTSIEINGTKVRQVLEPLARNADLSKFIL